MTHKGIPDYQRAARYILKDFVTVCEEFRCHFNCVIIFGLPFSLSTYVFASDFVQC